MNTVRLNITLPTDLGDALKNRGNKSAFIAEAIRERLAREQETQLAELLKEGYSATFEEDQILSREWDPVTGDGIA